MSQHERKKKKMELNHDTIILSHKYCTSANLADTSITTTEKGSIAVSALNAL
jgi:hypothetical protein